MLYAALACGASVTKIGKLFQIIKFICGCSTSIRCSRKVVRPSLRQTHSMALYILKKQTKTVNIA